MQKKGDMKILKKGVESENASVFVVYDNDDNLVTLGKYISYKIQRSLYFYYISHYREIDWRDFVTFIRKDKDLRQTLRLIIENRFYNVNKSTFDFAVNACDIKFFSSEEQDEDNFNCSEMFSEDETIILMKVLMIKQQSIYYLRLRQDGL